MCVSPPTLDRGILASLCFLLQKHDQTLSSCLYAFDVMMMMGFSAFDMMMGFSAFDIMMMMVFSAFDIMTRHSTHLGMAVLGTAE